MSNNAFTTIQRKKELIEALSKTLGIVSHACDKVGCARSDYYDYMREDPEFKRAVEDIAERQVDFVESKFMQNVSGGDTTAQIFFLKCKGKKRGYIERQEIAIGNLPGEDFNVNISSDIIDAAMNKIYGENNGSSPAPTANS